MLTESEREWAIKKSKWIKRIICYLPEYPTKDELLNAAEFSERVAARLATDENCGVDEDCPPDMPFGWGRLKAARLAIEDEMDGENS